VSLLSPDKVTLHISPARVQGVRTSGLRGRIVAAFQVDAVVHAADDWLGLTKACTALCKALKAKRVHVVLSDSMVRHACFPWRAELRSTQEDLAFAQLSFDDVYGANASQEWHLAFSLAAPGESRLMVAIPKSLFDVLSGNFSDKLPPVRSITTGFTHTMSSQQGSLPNDGWLVNVEDHTVTFGSWTADGWSWVNTVRAAAKSADDLNALLRQELTISGASISSTQPITVAINSPPLTQPQTDHVPGVRMTALKAIQARFTQLGVPA
jgi:hypothetical protein